MNSFFISVLKLCNVLNFQSILHLIINQLTCFKLVRFFLPSLKTHVFGLTSFSSGLVTLIPFYLVAKLQKEGCECPCPEHSLQTGLWSSSLSLLVVCWKSLLLPELWCSRHGCRFHLRAKPWQWRVLTMKLLHLSEPKYLHFLVRDCNLCSSVQFVPRASQSR